MWHPRSIDMFKKYVYKVNMEDNAILQEQRANF